MFHNVSIYLAHHDASNGLSNFPGRKIGVKTIFRWALPLLLGCLLSGLLSQTPHSNTLTLVESVPVGTQLGLSQTLRTNTVWLDMITHARHTIDIEIFYLSHQKGQPLEQILRALIDATYRGVTIRILVDGKFYRIYPTTLDSLQSVPGISLKILPFFNQLGGVQHAKFFIVDRQDAFVGSQNFDWRALKHIHEIGVRIRHPRLAQLLEAIFEYDWQLASGHRGHWSSSLPTITPAQPDSVYWNNNVVFFYPTFSPALPHLIPPHAASDEAAILALIEKAQKEINIQLLTYFPFHRQVYYHRLENALRSAASRGVRVNLLVSNWNTRKPDVVFLKSLQVIPNIEVRFTTIPRFNHQFIPFARVEHCKYMVIDRQMVWLGTGNWGYEYFHQSRNVGIVFMNSTLAHTFWQLFQKSWTSPYAQPIDPCKNYPPPQIGHE